MLRIRILLMLAIALAFPAGAADSTYRDPRQPSFTLLVPDGWTAEKNSQGVTISRGDSWFMLLGAPTLEIFALVAVAVLGTTGHLLLILALGKAPASTLMPFQYAQLPVAALAGYLVFQVAPDRWSWLGMSTRSIACCSNCSRACLPLSAVSTPTPRSRRTAPITI